MLYLRYILKILQYSSLERKLGIKGYETLINKQKRLLLIENYQLCITKTVVADLQAFFILKIIELWNQVWKQYPSKLLEVKPSLQPWDDTSTNRFHQVIRTIFRLGHTRATHLHLITKEPQSNGFRVRYTVIGKTYISGVSVRQCRKT